MSCGNEALVIDGAQQSCFNELRLNDRASDLDDRLIGKNRRSLGNGPDITGKLEGPQIFEKRFGEYLKISQVCQILVVKAQCKKIIDHLIQTGRDRKTAALWNRPKKQIEISNGIFHPMVKISF